MGGQSHWRALLGLVTPHRKRLTVMISVLAIAGALPLLGPLLIASFIDEAQGDAVRSELLTIAGYLCRCWYCPAGDLDRGRLDGHRFGVASHERASFHVDQACAEPRSRLPPFDQPGRARESGRWRCHRTQRFRCQLRGKGSCRVCDLARPGSGTTGSRLASRRGARRVSESGHWRDVPDAQQGRRRSRHRTSGNRAHAGRSRRAAHRRRRPA
ncbi:hypothetical protein GQR58_030618 [Nymphon striatum]|nr:hypothetical protein GQR58_030618 [Nymphon striatum]